MPTAIEELFEDVEDRVQKDLFETKREMEAYFVGHGLKPDNDHSALAEQRLAYNTIIKHFHSHETRASKNAMRTLGPDLKRLMDKQGLTPEALAQKIRYSKAAITGFMEGYRVPSKEGLEMLCAAVPGLKDSDGYLLAHLASKKDKKVVPVRTKQDDDPTQMPLPEPKEEPAQVNLSDLQNAVYDPVKGMEDVAASAIADEEGQRVGDAMRMIDLKHVILTSTTMTLAGVTLRNFAEHLRHWGPAISEVSKHVDIRFLMAILDCHGGTGATLEDLQQFKTAQICANQIKHYLNKFYPTLGSLLDGVRVSGYNGATPLTYTISFAGEKAMCYFDPGVAEMPEYEHLRDVQKDLSVLGPFPYVVEIGTHVRRASNLNTLSGILLTPATFPEPIQEPSVETPPKAVKEVLGAPVEPPAKVPPMAPPNPTVPIIDPMRAVDDDSEPKAPEPKAVQFTDLKLPQAVLENKEIYKKYYDSVAGRLFADDPKPEALEPKASYAENIAQLLRKFGVPVTHTVSQAIDNLHECGFGDSLALLIIKKLYR